MGFGVLKGLRGALESSVNRVGHAELETSGFNMLNSRIQGSSGSQVKGERDGRKKALVVHRERRVGILVMRKGAERNEIAGLGRAVDRRQGLGTRFRFGGDFLDEVNRVQC